MSDDPAGGPPVMTVPELAARLGIDPSTAFRYLRSGKLPGVQVGSRWLIDRARVERFLAGLEDAAGRPLIQAPLVNDAPLAPGASLTLLPERPPDTTETAITWLRGAQAAVDLLVGGVAGMGHAEGDEGTGHRLRA